MMKRKRRKAKVKKMIWRRKWKEKMHRKLGKHERSKESEAKEGEWRQASTELGID